MSARMRALAIAAGLILGGCHPRHSDSATLLFAAAVTVPVWGPVLLAYKLDQVLSGSHDAQSRVRVAPGSGDATELPPSTAAE